MNACLVTTKLLVILKTKNLSFEVHIVKAIHFQYYAILTCSDGCATIIINELQSIFINSKRNLLLISNHLHLLSDPSPATGNHWSVSNDLPTLDMWVCSVCVWLLIFNMLFVFISHQTRLSLACVEARGQDVGMSSSTALKVPNLELCGPGWVSNFYRGSLPLKCATLFFEPWPLLTWCSLIRYVSWQWSPGASIKLPISSTWIQIQTNELAFTWMSRIWNLGSHACTEST